MPSNRFKCGTGAENTSPHVIIHKNMTPHKNNIDNDLIMNWRIHTFSGQKISERVRQKQSEPRVLSKVYPEKGSKRNQPKSAMFVPPKCSRLTMKPYET